MKHLFALAIVAALVTTGCKNDKGEATTSASTTATASRIVYVNTDTLLTNYDYYKDVVKEFENKRFAAENELQRRSKSFQNEVALFQRQVQAGGMSQEQGQTKQQQLALKEQDIMMYRDNTSSALAEEQAGRTDELISNIQDYLKKYNEDDRYDMVIGYSKGGGVLYAKEKMDITAEVLKGLNEEYASKKDKPSAKADSTAKK
ncbi:MAG: OmpH family outer membrane protein [Spirosomaceae bacterium]|nr:OmpH family outer membrane protein [Spirosomataceae bacterium]